MNEQERLGPYGTPYRVVNENEELLTLQKSAMHCLINNIDAISVTIDNEGHRQLREHVDMINPLCDRFIGIYHNLNDQVVNIFRATEKTRLKDVKLMRSHVTVRGLEIILQHNLQNLSLWYCDNLNLNLFSLLARYGKNLQALELGFGTQLLHHESHETEMSGKIFDFLLNCTRLKHLVMESVVLDENIQFGQLNELSYLDLSTTCLGNFSLQGLCNLPNLRSLKLFDVWPMESHIAAICGMTNLRLLDIGVGVSDSPIGIFEHPNETLRQIIENLPELTHLNISGTNLAGTNDSNRIPALVSRRNNRLKFLGLYGTNDEACRREDIPADRISGDANEEQILNAGYYYLDRCQALSQILTNLNALIANDEWTERHETLKLILTAMDRHVHLQILGCNVLDNFLWRNDKEEFELSLRNHIVRTMVNFMKHQIENLDMLEKGIRFLGNFQLLSDVIFEYDEVIKLLLQGFSRADNDSVFKTYILDLLVENSGNDAFMEKLTGYDFGLERILLNFISHRLDRSVFDEYMKSTWTFLWYVSTRSSDNFKRFVTNGGVAIISNCLNVFEGEMKESIIVHLFNGAKYEWVRQEWLTTELLEGLSGLLDSGCDDTGVSIRAAGTLAFIAFDGPQAWSVENPSRSTILTRMDEAIDRWNLNKVGTFSIHTFKDVLKLVGCYETPQSQHWALWIMAHLTQVGDDRYCELIAKERGIEIIREVMQNPSASAKARNFATKLNKKYESWSSGQGASTA